MFVRLGLLWLAALALSLACCFFLGSLHRPGAPPRPFTQRALLGSDLSRYGSHSQLQIAAALFCSLVLATWAAAEAPRLNASIAKCSYRRRRRPRSTQSEDFRHPSYFLQDPAAQGVRVTAAGGGGVPDRLNHPGSVHEIRMLQPRTIPASPRQNVSEWQTLTRCRPWRCNLDAQNPPQSR